MTLLRYVDWIMSIIVGFAVVALISGLLSRIKKKWVKVLIFLVKAVLATGLALLLIAFASPFLWKFDYPLMGLYIALLCDCFCDIVMSIISLTKKETKKGFRTLILGIIVLIFTLYGTVNMQIIREDHLSFSSDKLETKHSFVFLSDLHYGSSQSKRTVEKAVKKIEKLSPEFIVLGGDIVDEHTEKEEMEWVFGQFGSLDIPVYYIYGNHDRQDRGDYIGGQRYSEEELANTIRDSGIVILRDDFTEIGEDLVLLGREDPSNDARKAVKDLPSWPKDRYVISIEHTPYQNDDIVETDAELQLSGHTHAGQFFPIRTVYNLLGLNVVYTYKIGNTDLYVSPGIAGWYVPFRNESHCSYVVVELSPK